MKTYQNSANPRPNQPRWYANRPSLLNFWQRFNRKYGQSRYRRPALVPVALPDPQEANRRAVQAIMLDDDLHGLGAMMMIPALPLLTHPEEGVKDGLGWKRGQMALNGIYIQFIASTYGSYSERVANALELPVELLISFIHTESMGNQRAGFSKETFYPPGVGRGQGAMSRVSPYKGMMQIDNSSATVAIIRAKKLGLLTPAVMTLLAGQIGPNRLAAIMKFANESPSTWNGSRITDADLAVANTNIMLGGLFLKTLILRYNGRLDMAIVGYNAGSGRMDGIARKLGGTSASVAAVFRDAPAESKGYILKVGGTNGTLTNLLA